MTTMDTLTKTRIEQVQASAIVGDVRDSQNRPAGELSLMTAQVALQADIAGVKQDMHVGMTELRADMNRRFARRNWFLLAFAVMFVAVTAGLSGVIWVLTNEGFF